MFHGIVLEHCNVIFLISSLYFLIHLFQHNILMNFLKPNLYMFDMHLHHG